MRKKSLSILAAGVVFVSVMGAASSVSAAEFVGPVKEEEAADLFTDGEQISDGGLNHIASQLVAQTEEKAQKYFEDRENAEVIAQARKKAEEELQKAEEERVKAEEERKKAEEERKKAEEERKKAEEERKKAEEARKKAEEEAQKKAEKAEAERVAKRQEIVNFALQFEGNPYVYGGTSLTNGADCSGFVMSVFAEFGYELPRVAAAQCEASAKKDISQIEPGDLVFYGAYGIDHVALYIGDGKIIHASTSATGIKISDYDYNTPVAVGTYLE